MGLFSIFRKPRVSAAYLDADEYMRATTRNVLPSEDALPDPAPVTPATGRSEALAEMLLDASRAIEDPDNEISTYVPLESTSNEIYGLILDENIPTKNRTRVQLNVLYARDHEAWMRTLESDLEALSREPDSSDFKEALIFRNEQLETRKRALTQSALGLEAVGDSYSEWAHELRLKIAAIERVLEPTV